MTMEIDALHAGQPMRNSLDPCNTCAEWQQQAERVRVLREALEHVLQYCDVDMTYSIERVARAALKATQ